MSALTATVAALPRAGRIRPRPGLILAGLFAAVVVAAALVPQLLAPHDPWRSVSTGRSCRPALATCSVPTNPAATCSAGWSTGPVPRW
ncbi:hypothetical protein ACFQX6_05250 [Streptosporangium lutulentum]